MQLGLYLHEGITPRVRHIVSEDSGHFDRPFLLIVRTERIVTASHETSSVGSSGFPAYSRIYRQQRLTYCLTTF